MEFYKNKVAWCPICDQGWVEIYKDKNTKNLFVVVMSASPDGNIQMILGM